ncbi:nucleotidyltransferase domain-containing protein [Candidatus Woesearchaeota archaeon]|nr:nucleotidyltransferase domain-containing protein [Candidatus Woesearchaeota archaeon]
MEFKIERRVPRNTQKYPTDDLQLSRKFAQELSKELGDFLMGVVVFGSVARKQSTEQSDIDILIITDDTNYIITEPLIEGYRLIVERVMEKISSRFHITSMTFTTFWEQSRAGDPIVVNILRDGVGLYDTGFFSPLQGLLQSGKVRPSEESIWHYFGRSPRTLLNSRWHVLQATLDLYWGVIDAAHAALMRANQVPPTPEHVADLLETVYVKKGLLPKKYVEVMRMFYRLSKDITHREIKDVNGKEYDQLYSQADDFVKVMRKLVERGKY